MLSDSGYKAISFTNRNETQRLASFTLDALSSKSLQAECRISSLRGWHTQRGLCSSLSIFQLRDETHERELLRMDP